MAFNYVSYQTTDSGNANSPITIGVNIGTRTNGLLVVKTVMYVGVITGITYDGIAMTEAIYHPSTQDSDWHYTIYGLHNPSNGDNDLVITYTGSDLVTFTICSWYDGSNQTSPIDQAEGADGPSGAPTDDITPTVDNELCVSLYHDEDVDVLTVGSGETQIDTYDDSSRTFGASYVIQTAKGTQTMDWQTPGGTHVWGLVCASFKALADDTGLSVNVSPAGNYVQVVTP